MFAQFSTGKRLTTNGTKYYYTVMAANGAGQGPASGEASATPLAAPSVSAWQVNDGSVQRSKVSTLTVSFGQTGVTYSSMAAAFTLTRRSDGATFAVTGATATADGKGWVLSFAGDAGVDASGLPDGRYDLVVHGSAMQNANQLAGTGDQTFTFTRLFGDVNGDGAVSSKDYDSLLFGAPRLARFVGVQGREFLPSRGISRIVPPELIDLAAMLRDGRGDKSRVGTRFDHRRL